MKLSKNIIISDIIQYLKDSFFSVIIFLFALLPLLPFKLKGLPVLVFICFTLFVFKNKQRNFSYIFLINLPLYIIYISSLFYSTNIKYGLSLLETTVSILILPISFILYSRYERSTKSILTQDLIFKATFITSSFILSTLIFIISFQYGDYISTKIELSKFLFRLNKGFFGIRDHPIYLSIYISLSLLMIVSLFKNIKKHKIKILLIVIGFFQFFILMLLSRKGVIISFFISSLTLFFLNQKRKKEGLLLITLFILVSSSFVYKFTPDTIKRFKEIFDVKSYNNIEEHSSTSIRYGVYNCAIQKISESWIIGHGIGDVKSELLNCYKKKSKVLTNENLNSHNQFFGILLSVGTVGLLIFIIPLLINLKLFFENRDYFAFCKLLMFIFFMFFENILDRQSGVILFAFLLNFYTYKNFKLKNND